MAEPDLNAMEDEDLEDGEIETDEEIEEIKPAPAPIPIRPVISNEPVKKINSIDDDSKKLADVKGKNDHRKSTPDSSSTKSKKQSASDVVAKGKFDCYFILFFYCFYLTEYSNK